VTSATVRKLRAVLLPGLAAGALAAGAAAWRGGVVESFERLLWDARARAAARSLPASARVVTVDVDEATVALAGGTYPIPRGALAAIVREARAAGAGVIALDLVLSDPLEGSLADENAQLEEALAGGDVVLAAVPSATASAPRPTLRVVTASGPEADPVRRHLVDVGGAARPERFVVAPPLPRFARAAAALGGVSQQQEDDGRVHALRHVYPTGDGDLLSLPLAAAWLAEGRPALRLEGGTLRVGAVRAPLTPDDRVLVRWTGAWDGDPDPDAVYRQVSGADLLQAALARDGDGAPPDPARLAALRGAVAVVSVSVAGGKDKRPTPVNPRAVGGETLATAIDGFLRGAFVARTGPLADAGATLALALLAALLVGAVGLLPLRSAPAAALSVAAVGALGGGWWLLAGAAAARGHWIAAAAPLGGAVLSALAADLRLLSLERRDRQFVHDALGRYTSPALVRTLLERRELLDRFGGARQELTVYFSDLRGFTTLSEGMPPERLVELLNAYLSAQTEIVERHGGYVDKYIGDAIMAVWGAPLPVADHAARACRAALELRDGLAARRPGWQERFGVELFARAGVNTCQAVAGNVGSARKTQYTVLGDGVNLASRLEGANKAYGSEILVGDATRAAAGPEFAFRALDLLRVKGKAEGVPVHELVAVAAALSPDDRAWLAAWDAALALYRAARLAEARAAFAALAAARPADAPAHAYVARCEALAAAPLPPGWDGVFELHDK
jgi:adenylate cyclase